MLAAQKRFLASLAARELLLTEGALLERLRRDPRIELHPRVANTSLLYTPEGRAALATIWREYMDVGREHDLGMLVCTPTWRASSERLAQAEMRGVAEVSRDAVSLLAQVRSEYGEYGHNVYIGGLIGCRGDAYRPDEALDSVSAEHFHREQAEALAEAEVDFLIAQTLPALTEAIGIARAMAGTGCPYVISFVLRPSGALLDGTCVAEAIARIDAAVSPAPAAYMVNCVHPLNCALALGNAEATCPGVGKRLVGLQGNTSRKSPEELDNAAELDSDEPEQFAAAMIALRERFGMHILGGCCGTDKRHITAVARRLRQRTDLFSAMSLSGRRMD